MRYDLTTSQKAILLTKNYMHANEKIIYNLIKKKKTHTNVRFLLMQTNSCYYYSGIVKITYIYCKVGSRL